MNAIIKKYIIGAIAVFVSASTYADVELMNNTTDANLEFYVGLGTCYTIGLFPRESYVYPTSPVCQFFPEITSIAFLNQKNIATFYAPDEYLGNSTVRNVLIVSGTYPNYTCSWDGNTPCGNFKIAKFA